MADENDPKTGNAIELATQLTIAWLSNPNVKTSAEEVPAFLKAIHATLGALSGATGEQAAEAGGEHKPAVPVRSSVKPDFITSLIDGRKLKSLKRHLTMHGLTPKEYRERYGLKADYPMVAPNYSAQRREVAKKLGLGRKPRATAAPDAVAATAGAMKLSGKAVGKPAAKPNGEAKPKAAKAAAAKVAKPVAASTTPAKRGRPRKVVAPAA